MPIGTQITALRSFVSALGGFLLFGGVITLPFAGVPLAYVGLSYGFGQAVATAALTLLMAATLLSVPIAITYAVLIIGPVLFLIRQSLLSRQTEDEAFEFYPLDKLILLGLAITAGGTVLIYLAFAGQDGGLPGLFARAMWQAPEIRDALSQIYDISSQQDMNAIANLVLVTGLASWPLIVLGNLQIGQTASTYFGRNLRPTPNYEALRLPEWLVYLLLASMVSGVVLSGWPANLATALAAICTIAYFLLGLAIIHAISRGWNGRVFVLAGLYFLLMVAAWVIIPVSLLGLLDTRLNFRRLANANQTPPNDNGNEE